MKFCKNKNAVLVAALAAFMAFFAGCSSDSDVAGNSAETGSPELAGILVLDNGKPAARTKVQCVPSGYNILATSKAEQVLPSAFETVTDENGNYEFDSIPSGSFTLEAFHQESGQMLLLQNLSVEQDEPLAINDTLRYSGSVKLLVPGAFRENQSGDAIIIGTTFHKRVSVQNGKIVIDSLPADTFNLIIYMDKLYPVSFENVSVQPNETTVWGDLVTYIFKGPLALPENESNNDSSGVNTDIPLVYRLTANNLDSLTNSTGRWEAVRISKDGNRSKKLPITQAFFDSQTKEAVFWVNVDSLNISDSLELRFDNTMAPAFASDVFPTNRNYSLVYHFENWPSPIEDSAEKGYFGGVSNSATGVKNTKGVIGDAIALDSNTFVTVENSAIADSSRKVNLNYDGSEYFCFSVWVQLESLDKEQKIFEKEKEYELRFDPDKGFVVNLWVPDSVNYLYSWASGTSGVKAGEWVYVAFSRHTTSQVVFYLNKTKIESEPERIAWGGARDLKDFKVGGFAGKIDELMLGSCFRDDDWTRLTYLNQKPTDYWPVLQVLK